MVASNTYGRQVVLVLTNKSGGSVAAGDVVIVDTSNNDAFTTTTTAGFTGLVGVAQETIASNAVGRILVSGYAALVNVNASVTRGQYGKTHTVAKQATGIASRGPGTFCQWLTGGTTPDAVVYPVDLLGTSLTNPMTTTGDLIYSSDNSGTPARRGIGSTGQALIVSGGLPTWGTPSGPGTELDYVQITANVTISATTAATGNTIITGGSVTYDGSTVVFIEFWCPRYDKGGTAVTLDLWEDSTDIARIGVQLGDGPGGLVRVRRTPSAASHVYKVTGYTVSGTGTVYAGAGGVDVMAPAFIRVVKV